jgi:hypothetical protein
MSQEQAVDSANEIKRPPGNLHLKTTRAIALILACLTILSGSVLTFILGIWGIFWVFVPPVDPAGKNPPTGLWNLWQPDAPYRVDQRLILFCLGLALIIVPTIYLTHFYISFFSVSTCARVEKDRFRELRGWTVSVVFYVVLTRALHESPGAAAATIGIISLPSSTLGFQVPIWWLCAAAALVSLYLVVRSVFDLDFSKQSP